MSLIVVDLRHYLKRRRADGHLGPSTRSTPFPPPQPDSLRPLIGESPNIPENVSPADRFNFGHSRFFFSKKVKPDFSVAEEVVQVNYFLALIFIALVPSLSMWSPETWSRLQFLFYGLPFFCHFRNRESRQGAYFDHF